jgi:hypothetical protein
MTGRIGIDVLAVALCRTQRQHSWARCCNVLDHDVEVELLRHGGIRPGRWPVAGGTLECQARGRIAGGDHDPVAVTVCHRQAQQGGVEPGEGTGVWAIQDHMVHPSDHAADHARHGEAAERRASASRSAGELAAAAPGPAGHRPAAASRNCPSSGRSAAQAWPPAWPAPHSRLPAGRSYGLALRAGPAAPDVATSHTQPRAQDQHNHDQNARTDALPACRAPPIRSAASARYQQPECLQWSSLL